MKLAGPDRWDEKKPPTGDSSELVELQKTLYASRNPTRRWLHCMRRDWIFATMERFANSGGAALEVGPGSGVYLPKLATLFQRVTAVDVDTDYLGHLTSLTERHPNLLLLRDDVTCSALPDASFDLILCTEVIEHIADSQTALWEMHRLLKPSGALVLSTPQRYSPLETAAKIAFLPGVIDVVRLIYREPILETGHINLMTEREARHQLTAARFAIQEQFKSGMYLPVVAEFGGELGLRLERWLERRVRNSALDWLLWTQYYVARK